MSEQDFVAAVRQELAGLLAVAISELAPAVQGEQPMLRKRWEAGDFDAIGRWLIGFLRQAEPLAKRLYQQVRPEPSKNGQPAKAVR